MSHGAEREANGHGDPGWRNPRARARTFEATRRCDPTSQPFLAVVDEEGILARVSPLAAAVFGITEDEAPGRSMFQYVAALDIERVLIRHAAVLRTPGNVLVELIDFVDSSGHTRAFELQMANCRHLAEFAGVVLSGIEVNWRDEFRSELHESLQWGGDAAIRCVRHYDPTMVGHHQQVTEIAGSIARSMELPAGVVTGIEVASSLHDIGEIGTPSGMLSDSGDLDGSVWESFTAHPRAGALILSDVGFPWPVAEMILQHHEHLDGTGYPDGLRGRSIGIGARIVAVADTVAAMSSLRPHRPAVGPEAALAVIERDRGTAYDPVVVDHCLDLFRRQQFRLTPVVVAS